MQCAEGGRVRGRCDTQWCRTVSNLRNRWGAATTPQRETSPTYFGSVDEGVPVFIAAALAAAATTIFLCSSVALGRFFLAAATIFLCPSFAFEVDDTNFKWRVSVSTDDAAIPNGGALPLLAYSSVILPHNSSFTRRSASCLCFSAFSDPPCLHPDARASAAAAAAARCASWVAMISLNPQR